MAVPIALRFDVRSARLVECADLIGVTVLRISQLLIECNGICMWASVVQISRLAANAYTCLEQQWRELTSKSHRVGHP